MYFTITKEFTFSASHRLEKVPDGHPCGRVHGHNYVVRVEIQGRVVGGAMGGAQPDWVLDYGALKVVRDFIDDEWDHRDLNEWFANHCWDMDPTAEALSWVLTHEMKKRWEGIPQGLNVQFHVSETPKVWAVYPTGFTT